MNLLMPEGSIGSILTIALRVASALRDLSAVPDYVKQIMTEAEAFRSMVILLRGLLLQNEQQNSDALKTIYAHNLASQLMACLGTFEMVEKVLEKVKEDNMGISDRAQWKWHDEEMKSLLRSLESHKLTLNIILGILSNHQMQKIERQNTEILNWITERRHRVSEMSDDSFSPNVFPASSSVITESAESHYNTSGEIPIIVGSWYEEILLNSRVYKTKKRDDKNKAKSSALTLSTLHASGQSIFSYRVHPRRSVTSTIQQMRSDLAGQEFAIGIGVVFTLGLAQATIGVSQHHSSRVGGGWNVRRNTN